MSPTRLPPPLLGVAGLIAIAGCNATENPSEVLQRALAAYQQTADRSGVTAQVSVAPHEAGQSLQPAEPAHEHDQDDVNTLPHAAERKSRTAIVEQPATSSAATAGVGRRSGRPPSD